MKKLLYRLRLIFRAMNVVRQNDLKLLDPSSVTITLNRYQHDNLLWLLELIHSGYLLHGVNTGDWVGEIKWLMSLKGFDPAIHKANISIEEWITQMSREDEVTMKAMLANWEERLKYLKCDEPSKDPKL